MIPRRLGDLVWRDPVWRALVYRDPFGLCSLFLC